MSRLTLTWVSEMADYGCQWPVSGIGNVRHFGPEKNVRPRVSFSSKSVFRQLADNVATYVIAMLLFIELKMPAPSVDRERAIKAVGWYILERSIDDYQVMRDG